MAETPDNGVLWGWEPTKCEDFQQSLHCHLVPIFCFAFVKQTEKHIFFCFFYAFSLKKVTVWPWPSKTFSVLVVNFKSWTKSFFTNKESTWKVENFCAALYYYNSETTKESLSSRISPTSLSTPFRYILQICLVDSATVYLCRRHLSSVFPCRRKPFNIRASRRYRSSHFLVKRL